MVSYHCVYMTMRDGSKAVERLGPRWLAEWYIYMIPYWSLVDPFFAAVERAKIGVGLPPTINEDNHGAN